MGSHCTQGEESGIIVKSLGVSWLGEACCDTKQSYGEKTYNSLCLAWYSNT